MGNIKADYKVYNLTPFKLIAGFFLLSSFWLVFMYRISNFLWRKKVPIIPRILRVIGIILYSADVSPAAIIGQGFCVSHTVGIVIGAGVKIGNNFRIFQNTTIGGRAKEIDGKTMPTIGNNVAVYTGACVLGPVNIGDNVQIGANAVVTKDFPANCIVTGVPAKITRKKDNLDTDILKAK